MVSSEGKCGFRACTCAFLVVFMGCLSFLFIRDWLNELFTLLEAIQLGTVRGVVAHPSAASEPCMRGYPHTAPQHESLCHRHVNQRLSSDWFRSGIAPCLQSAVDNRRCLKTRTRSCPHSSLGSSPRQRIFGITRSLGFLGNPPRCEPVIGCLLPTGEPTAGYPVPSVHFA